LALGERQPAQIDIALKQYVEGKESHPRHVGPALAHLSVKGAEIGPTTVVANAQFAVQDGRDCRKLHESFREAGQAICPLSTALREEPNCVAVLGD
jgi:hypothetical protein